jgi:glycogen debranching enzyme
MDVKLGDWVVTPRYGKPVEIQALWYNALLTMRDLAAHFGDSASQRRAARPSFKRLFWNEDSGCL